MALGSGRATVMTPEDRAFIDRHRVGHLATAAADSKPHIVQSASPSLRLHIHCVGRQAEEVGPPDLKRVPSIVQKATFLPSAEAPHPIGPGVTNHLVRDALSSSASTAPWPSHEAASPAGVFVTLRSC